MPTSVPQAHFRLSSNKVGPDWNQRDEFFNFTRARFVRDEANEMAQRHVQFDMNELTRLAAAAVGSRACVDVEKYPDGMFNKAFLLTMNDGAQVVAKVPNPNAGLPHLTTASEVATMDFAHNICGTPAPRVFAWSSRAAENPVGAEYIIMERLPGVQLSSVWADLRIDKKIEVIKAIAAQQKNWLSVCLNRYGSLYYAKDVDKIPSGPFTYTDKDGVQQTDVRFAIGPSVHRHTIDYGRANVDFDRGPWTSVGEHYTAIGEREIACVKSIDPLPKPPLTLVGRYIPTREKKLAALESYLKLLPFLLPVDDSITTSHVWHSDLHGENIFVDAEDPTKVIGIIDWQSAALVPLFENLPQPALLDYDGPALNGLERPQMPENLDELDAPERAAASRLWEEMTLACYYQNLIFRTNPTLYGAIAFRDTIGFDLLSYARNMLLEGEAIYQERLLKDLKEAWDDLPAVKAQGNPRYPFEFTESDVAAIRTDYEAVLDGMACMSEISEEMGHLFPSAKCIRHEDYEASRELFKVYKEKVLCKFARDDDERKAVQVWWPFD